MKSFKFIDLFAGIGGIRLGFEQVFKEKKTLQRKIFIFLTIGTSKNNI